MNLHLNETFAALKHYNYRLWFIGQMVSLMGTWMQATAQGYLIYQITKSTTYLGLVGFMGGSADLAVFPVRRLVADRISRRTLLVITQTSMMILAFILGALDFANIVKPWHILVLAFLLGVANAFDAPARISFVLELVEREDMNNAIALNSTMYNIATVVGPSVAGLTYAAFGPAWCFTINGISFIAVIVALLLMHINMEPQPVHSSSAMAEIAEGVRYVISNPPGAQPDRSRGNGELIRVRLFEPVARLGNGRAARRCDHQRPAGISPWIRCPRQRADAGFSGEAKVARKTVDARLSAHAGGALYFCLGRLDPAFPGNPGHHRLEHDAGDQQQQFADPDRGPRRPAGPGNGRICHGNERRLPHRDTVDRSRCPELRRSSHSDYLRGDHVLLCGDLLGFLPFHPPAWIIPPKGLHGYISARTQPAMQHTAATMK